MNVKIAANVGEYVRVFINDALVCEWAVGVRTRCDLASEVEQARHLRVFPDLLTDVARRMESIINVGDHVNTSAEAKRAAFVRGLLDGWLGRAVPHPSGPLIPPIRPEQSPTYDVGYNSGASMRRFTVAIQKRDDATAVERVG